MRVAWSRLIRFEATDGRVLRGQPILPTPDFDLGTTTEATQLKANIITGDDIYSVSGDTVVTDEVVTVKTLLGPLAAEEIPILRCVGLNYATHSEISALHYVKRLAVTDVRIVKETGRKPPPYPFIFFKPNTTVLDHGADVVIPKICQNDQADYEGELCIIIGKDAKDVSPEDALSYVAAYTCGNDISSRKLQRNPEYAGVIPQWGFSKGFDTFAPLGPCLVRPDVVGDLEKLVLTTTINSDVRQKELVGDLLFDCAYIISYLSTGTTLQKGSVIMTGTPGGKISPGSSLLVGSADCAH